MPKFALISPGESDKESNWDSFASGGYVAMGSRVRESLAGKKDAELNLIMRKYYSSPREIGRKAGDFKRLLSLVPGDYVAAKYGNAGLFGIGIVTKPYAFLLNKHDAQDKTYYHHFVEVRWLCEKYIAKDEILRLGGKAWSHQGNINVYDEVPSYVGKLVQKYGSNDSPETSAKVMVHKDSATEDHPQRSAEKESPAVTDIVAALEGLPETDVKREVVTRAEQFALRRHFLGDAEKACCAICGCEYPVDFIWIAHIKRRCDCTDVERRDASNLMRACKFGCDDLFERGYLAVRDGKILFSDRVKTTEALEKYMRSFAGKICPAYNAQSKSYFDWHHANVFQNT